MNYLLTFLAGLLRRACNTRPQLLYKMPPPGLSTAHDAVMSYLDPEQDYEHPGLVP
jgi:hypothetical protein